LYKTEKVTGFFAKDEYIMLYYLICGGTYAFAAAVQPGPLQSYLFAQSLSQGWRKTLPAACAPLISDGPILILAVFVLTAFPVWSLRILQCAGSIFLLYLALQTWSTWRNFDKLVLVEQRTAQRTLVQAVGVNILNPAPYLGWSLVMGPLLLKGWSEHPINALALLVGFYATMIITQMCFIIVFAHTKKLGSQVVRILIGVSAVVLVVFALCQLWMGLSFFRSPMS
jgi:threonine/homoserine/homoserine lactone efflux protein